MTTPPGQQPPDWNNPYQQPGFSQGNPYQQTTQPLPATDGPVSLSKPSDSGGSGGSGRWKMPAAIAFAVLLVGGVTAGGIVTVIDRDGDTTAAAEPDDDADDDATDDDGDGDDDGDSEPEDDPRGSVRAQDPVVDDDWQVRVHRKRHVEYDVPEDWSVHAETILWGWEVEIEDEEEPASFLMGGPASYLEEFCGADSFRAATGVTGAVGSVGTEDAAENHALAYARAVFDPELEGDVTEHPPEPFSTEHGFEGHLAMAEINNYGYDEDDECATPSGKVLSIGYTDFNGDVMTWLMVVDTEVEDELDEETIDLITGSLRPLDSGEE